MKLKASPPPLPRLHGRPLLAPPPPAPTHNSDQDARALCVSGVSVSAQAERRTNQSPFCQSAWLIRSNDDYYLVLVLHFRVSRLFQPVSIAFLSFLSLIVRQHWPALPHSSNPIQSTHLID